MSIGSNNPLLDKTENWPVYIPVYNDEVILKFQGTFPVNDQLNEFGCYRSYSVTDYSHSYLEVTKTDCAFPCSSILFSIIS